MFFKDIKVSFSAIIIIFLISLARFVSPVTVYAEDEATPTPAVEQAEIQNNSVTDNDVVANADNGGSSINPTPTPTTEPTVEPQGETTPTPTEAPVESSPTPSPDPSNNQGTTISNDGNVDNDISSEGSAGGNEIVATDSASSPQADSASLDCPEDENSTESASLDQTEDQTALIENGDAVSIADVENSINSTNVNSEIINQTINLFVAENGNLDLSNPTQLVSDIISAHPSDPVINVSVVSIDNYSILTNDVISSANTGQNSINSQGDALIQTGDAYSLVSILNKVNFTVVNSKIHLITINIFGDLNGNIILPDQNSSDQAGGCNNCETDINIDNDATLTNNVDSLASSGENSITTTGSGEIITGDAKSSVNVINIVNSNLIGANVLAIYINNLGTWTGGYIGNLALFGLNGEGSCLGCAIDSLNIDNDATVSNNVYSTATTGGNSINGNNSTIRTGNAYSAVSIFNFINSNFVNSMGFFGFINIFGTWTGDIGEKSSFPVDEAPGQTDMNTSENVSTGNQENVGSQSEQTEPKKDEGGLLTITQSNNVGEYVLPGDTVTFFIDTRNIGSGKVYNATLELALIKDGQIVGGAMFKLGDIGIGKKIKVTTGLVLSLMAEPGIYTARAIVRGTVGEENREISATADSTFLVEGTGLQVLSSAIGKGKNITGVLGAKSLSMNAATSKKFDFLLLLLAVNLYAYFQLKVIRRRKILPLVFTRELNLGARLRAARTLLL